MYEEYFIFPQYANDWLICQYFSCLFYLFAPLLISADKNSKSFRPNKLRAVVNITTDNIANPKVLLQKMVDVLRKGELKTQEEPITRLTVDVRGFKFLNSKGQYQVLNFAHSCRRSRSQMLFKKGVFKN